MTRERSSVGNRRTPSLGTGLVLGMLAAFGASACCIGPLLLTGLGMGGSLASGLRIFDPGRPLLIVLSAGALFWAYTRLRKATQCGEDAADPLRRGKVSKGERLFWIAVLVSAGLIIFPWIRKVIS